MSSSSHAPSHSSRRRLLAAVLAVFALVLVARPAEAAPTTARASYGSSIEPLAKYQPQTICSAYAKPGVSDLAARLLRAYPGTRSLGIVRACSVGGRSEHKEGRAFDWGGLSASSATDRAKVASFTTWLLKTDRYGHKYAMARRLGIQYVIWNHRIWGSYAASSGWRTYTGANPHTDHVHISFTWAGARKSTSFWTGRVGAVVAAPKPPPVSTLPAPRPQPVRPSTLPTGPALDDETVTLPATATGVTMTNALVKGQPYLVEASGTWGFGGSGNVADPECSRTAADPTWRRDRSVHRLDPVSDHLDLYVDGMDFHGTPDTDTGGNCDKRNHMYRWTYTPDRSGRVTLTVWDPTKLSDNTGSLKIRVIKSVPRDELTWSVPAVTATGRTSPGALEAGATYTATVTGVVNAGNGVRADGECTVTAADPVWRRHRSIDANTSDDLDLTLDKATIVMTPAVQQNPNETCDSVTHTYHYTIHPTETRPVNMRIADPSPKDDSGSLRVVLSKVPPVEGRESLTVNTAVAAGTTTARVYPAGQPLVIRAVGKYTVGSSITADPECSRTKSDSTWRISRPELTGSDNQHLGDLTVNGLTPTWIPVSSSGSCDASHSYSLRYTPSKTGPLVLTVASERHTDNVGTLAVTVDPAP